MSLSEPTSDIDRAVSRQPDLTGDIEDRLVAIEALERLDERSRKIMVWRFYEELSQREIGERLGIGQVQVSRLLRSALERLRDQSARLSD